MTVAMIAVALLPVALVLYVLLGKRNGAHGFRGVTEYPIFGCLLGLPFADIQGYGMEIVEDSDHETMCMTVPGNARTWVTSDVRDIEVVLGKPGPDRFDKGPRFRSNFFDLLGRGIFNSDGADWLVQRKVASHLFSAARLKQQQELVFVRDAERLAALLCARRGEVIDLQNALYALTFDSFCEIAFGVSFGALEQTLEKNAKPAFLDAFDQAVATTTGRFPLPRGVWQLMSAFRIGQEGRMRAHMKLIDDTVFDLVDKVLALSPDELVARSDLLGLYAAHAHKTGDASLLDRKFLRDVVINFILAGRDTTASTLTSFFRLMGHFGDERARVEAEVDSVRGALTYDVLTKEHVFMNACIQETLRLFPPVPSDSKIYASDEPLTLPSGPKLKRNDIIAYKIAGVQRNRRYWAAPHDFRPQRWIDKSDVMWSKPVEQHQFYFLAFHAGRRLCLGKGMANVEAATCIATLLRAKLRFELVGADDLRTWRNTWTPTAVIALKRGLHVRVEQRS